jgi:hypothetical protein
MKFTKEELRLLEICFNMNNGDHYARNDLYPKWLQKDFGYSADKVENLFKSIAVKFVKFNEEKK